MEDELKAKQITDYFVHYLNDGNKPNNYDELVDEVKTMLTTD